MVGKGRRVTRERAMRRRQDFLLIVATVAATRAIQEGRSSGFVAAIIGEAATLPSSCLPTNVGEAARDYLDYGFQVNVHPPIPLPAWIPKGWDPYP